MQVDISVVGAGVVGLAIGARLARLGLDVMIVDGAASFGTGNSARNSEVIHAGLYYPAGSLKADLCVRGRRSLYAYCARRGVPHRAIGKLIFAGEPGQLAALEAIARGAAAAGVDDLVPLDAAAARVLEPALATHGALFSPSTGIVDAHALMLALLGEAEAHGAQFVPRTRVTRLSRPRGGGWGLHIDDSAHPALLSAQVVNAAGLGAHVLAEETEGLSAAHRPRVRYAKGNYFAYAGRVPFRHLIYPVPVPGGLGTHLTFDLAGAARFGPDVEWIEQVDHAVDAGRGGAFLAAARSIWPAVEAERLVPAYAGIRPKLSGPGEPAADFRIDGPEAHGLHGLVNLFGIESPGLTAALAIADLVAARLGLDGYAAAYGAADAPPAEARAS